MAIGNTFLGPAAIRALLRDRRRLWFIGIGGVHMSALALAAARRGFTVGGSDSAESPRLEKLRREGLPVVVGHDAARLDDRDAVIYTLAVAEDDPEYLGAIGRGLPLFSRADFLSFLAADYRVRIGVSGSHGKSTVTAMLAGIFTAAGRRPAVFCGAELPRVGSPLLDGGGEDCIFEACEYKDSFLCFSPTVALVLNMDLDHTDYFPDLAALSRSFAAFATLPGECGTVIVNAEDAPAAAAVADSPAKVYTFGLSRGDCHARDLRYEGGRGVFSVCLMDKICGEVRLAVPGEHNVKNALAAILAAATAGVPVPVILSSLGGFTGAARRMESRGTWCGARVFDDYAHHPAEIEASLAAAAQITPKTGRIFAVFQPHTYSRTVALFEGFCRALRRADRVFVADIYPARETDTLGMSAAKLAAGVGPRAAYVGDLAAIAAALRQELTAGDTLLLMGAGDVDRIFTLF